MDALAAFSQMTPEDDAGDHGPDITMIGRWHDLPRGSGVCILESDSAEAVEGWAYNWGAALLMPKSSQYLTTPRYEPLLAPNSLASH